jgi:hypothetical protein
MARECLANNSTINVAYSLGNKYAFNGRTTYPIQEHSASATVTFLSGIVPLDTQTVTIKSYDGQTIEYIATSGVTSSETNKFSIQSASGVASELKTCMVHASGHAGKISAALTPQAGSGIYNKLTLLQNAPGASGNLAITNGLHNTTTTNFSGGVDPLRYAMASGLYVLMNNSRTHPMAILNSGNSKISYTGNSAYKTTAAVSGTTADGTYDFYYGPIILSVGENFGEVSYYSSSGGGGYMGGKNSLVYDPSCSVASTIPHLPSGIDIEDLSGYLATQDEHYALASGIPTPNIKTVRPASHKDGVGDFTTIQAWEDYADGQSSPNQWAECYSGANLGSFTVDGWSSNPVSSGYPKIFAARGEGHGGNLNQGAYIQSYPTPSQNTISVPYTRVEGLRSNAGFHITTTQASNAIIKNCAVTSDRGTNFKAKSDFSSISSSGNLFINCLSVGGPNSSGIINYGFEIGSEYAMNGLSFHACINCTSYGHANVGFMTYDSSLPGLAGGSDTLVRNCLSMDNTGADFGAVTVGGNNDSSSFNVASDSSLKSNVSTNFENRPASGIFVNPSTEIHPISGVIGVFKLREPSVIATNGFSYQDLIAPPSGGSSLYYRYSRNPDDNNNWMFTDKSAPNRGFNFDITGTPRSSGEWHIGAFQYSSYKPTNQIDLFIGPSGILPRTNRSQFLFTEGASPVSSEINLYTKSNNPIEKSLRLFLDSSLPFLDRTLYIKGMTSEDATAEDEHQFLSFGFSGAGGGGGSGGGTGNSTKRTSQLNLFITTSFPAKGLSPIRKKRMTLSLKGVSEMVPEGFGLNKKGFGFNGYNRSHLVDSQDYIPYSDNKTLFVKTEPTSINTALHHYKFEPLEGTGREDEIGSLGLSQEPGVPSLFLDDLNTYRNDPTQPDANVMNIGHINTSYISATKMDDGHTFGHLYHDHHEDFSSDGGIAVSFWLQRMGYQTLEIPPVSQEPPHIFLVEEQPSADSGYLQTTYFNEESEFDESPEGIITKGDAHFSSEGNYQFFDGDWGIFKRGGTDAKEKDISFYVNVLDGPKENTIINEGFNIDTGIWYYIMYWIDPVGKESYVKYRRHNDYSGDRAKIVPLQKWDTRLLSSLQNETVAGYTALLAAQTTSHKFYLAHNAFNGKNLGETRGDIWGFDELKISKKVGSYYAMSQAFDSEFKSYLPYYYKTNTKTMFISGIDED